MTKENGPQLVKIRRALISVSDKTGIVEFARELKRFNVEIISTGGTAKALRDSGLDVRDVSEVTGFPEMMDGRIKTLHPNIHGALLGLRDKPEHVAAMREHGIDPIDMVVVSLYPFEQTISREGVSLEEAIEQIDIGGPAMIRSAAKNFKDIAVVISPYVYGDLLNEMTGTGGYLSFLTRAGLAISAFQRTSSYDSAVFDYLNSTLTPEIWTQLASTPIEKRAVTSLQSSFREASQLYLEKVSDLRYGENPHQKAALYEAGLKPGVANADLLSGKEMSFNNYVDADAAWQLVCDFDDLACAIIKHTNPAGAALGTSAEEAYRKALACDPVSAFGGIVAFNRNVDEAAARAVTEIFTEVIVAPDYETSAFEG